MRTVSPLPPAAPRAGSGSWASAAAIGLTPWPEVSEKAREEYRALFDLTGTTDFLEQIREEEDKPVELTYLEGRITGD